MNKLIKPILLSVLLLMFCGFNVNAQITINVALDTNIMLIGDQTKFTLEVNTPKGVDVTFPIFHDTIIDKLEVLNISSIDTTYIDDNIKLKQEYTVTSFDSGWYEIPPKPFVFNLPDKSKNDTVYSKSIYFGVVTMVLDTVNVNAITDIKDTLKAPLTFKEILPFAAVGLAVIILFILAYFIYMKFVKKEPIFHKHEKPKEPAHIIAFRDLDSLKNEKLWQEGRNKEFHSKLTDIIRTYIGDRFDILAMEATTDEIISEFKNSEIVDKELKKELHDTLVRADFVKFAKASTMPEENNKSLKFAYDFILKTKEEELVEEDIEADEQTDNKNKEQSNNIKE